MSSNPSRILAVIIARSGSKELPGKNMRILNGKPLLGWTIAAALAASCVNRVVLSSDDEKAIEYAKENGCDVPFQRPPELSGDNVSSDSVIEHALQSVGEDYDYVFKLQPTSPLRTEADIEGALAHCLMLSAPACVSVCPVERPVQWCYFQEANGKLSPVMSEALPSTRQRLRQAVTLNGAVYVAKVEWFRGTKCFVHPDSVGYLMPRNRSVDIDTAEDFELAEFYLSKQASSSSIVS
jgi:CMP-N,N'-diacetyllegionaminic acid synthase